MNRIYLSPPHLTQDAMVYLEDAVASNWIAPVGPHVDLFERELASVLKTDHVLVTNSGTSAIHLALLALGIGKGDEVVCSTLTFCASANPIIYCGATPVFVDAESDTWNMDPMLLERAILDRIDKIGKKPKAIIVVHLYGMPARMQELMVVARKYGIPVVEDAAEAFGSIYRGCALGTIGDIGILSFNGNKIITTSSGGAIFSNRQDIIDKVAYFRQEARESLAHYEHKAIGYNYRMSNLLAALGRSQLRVLDERVTRRREIFSYYTRAFEGMSFAYQEEGEAMRSNRWLSTLVTENVLEPVKLRLALEKNNIESRPLWKPMHLQPVFSGAPYYGNGVSESLFQRGLCLPSGSNLTSQDLERVVTVIKKTFA